MKKFSITTPIAYGVIAIGIFLSLIKPHWIMPPALILIGLMCVLSFAMLWFWPKREVLNHAYVEGFSKLPPRLALFKLVGVQALFWLGSAYIVFMLAWLMKQSARLQVIAPEMNQDYLLEHYLVWIGAPFVFIMAKTLVKIYLAFVRQHKPQAADFLFPNAKVQPRLFFHNVLVGVEGYGKLIGLSFLCAACILIFANGYTQTTYVPDLIDWPVQNGIFSLVFFFIMTKIMKHAAGFLQRKVRLLGPMLLGVGILTTLFVLFGHALGLMFTYPKLLYYQSISPMLTQLSAQHLNVRFEYFWLSWIIVWSEEVSQYLTRLSYGYHFRTILLGILVSALVLLGCFYFCLHVSLDVLLKPWVQMFTSLTLFLLTIAWFWRRDCAMKIRYGALEVAGKNRTLVLFIRRFLPLLPLLVGSYLMFGWMAAQFFTGAVLFYWVPITVLYLAKAVMVVWVEEDRPKDPVSIS